MSTAPIDVEWLAIAESGVRLGRTASGRIIEWPGIGSLALSDAGQPTASGFRPCEGVPEYALRKFLATDLLAYHRYLTGGISLHGSAVYLPEGAVVLLGESGAGKSTTAMALVELCDGRFMADDVVPIDVSASELVAHPVDDTFWLWSESRSWFGIPGSVPGKAAVRPKARSKVPSIVRAVVQLVFDEGSREPQLARLVGTAGFLAVSRAQVSFSFGAEALVKRDLDARALLVCAVPLYQLRRSREADNIRIVANMLATHVSREAIRSMNGNSQ